MPPATGYLLKAYTISVVASVTKVAEEHIFFVTVVLAFAAIFTVWAFPIIGGDKLQKFNVQADTSRMRRRFAFGAM